MKYFALFSFGVAVIMSFCCDFGVNITPSLPKGLYIGSDDTVQRGDIVTYCLDIEEFVELAQERHYLGQGSHLCPFGLRPLLKRVAGTAGDSVSIKDTKIYVTHSHTTAYTVWPSARSYDVKGRPLASVLQEGVIPHGKALLLTSYAGGFDSRYFGLVETTSLRKFKPFLTF